jgi:hypothetical protein
MYKDSWQYCQAAALFASAVGTEALQDPLFTVPVQVPR